jgi:anti-sigma factor RsiW
VSEHVHDRLSPFLDGELPPHERQEVEGHLESCAECAALLEDLAAVDALARDLPMPTPDAGAEAFAARVRARIAATRPRRRLMLPTWGWAAAAVLLLAVVTPLTLRERGSPAVSQAPARGDGARLEQAPAPAAAPPVTVVPLQDAREEDASADTRAPSPERRQNAAEGKAVARSRRDAPESGLAVPSSPDAVGEALGSAPEMQQPHPAPQVSREGFARAPEPAPPAAAPAKKREDHSGDKAAAFSAPAVPPPPPATPPAARDEALEEAVVATERHAEREKAAQGTRAGAAAAAGSPPPAPPGGRAKGSGADLGVSGRLEKDGGGTEAKLPYTSVAQARGAREAWRARAGELKVGPAADEARVRTIEAGLAAWQLSKDDRDRRVVDRDIADYLRRDDAVQAERVRSLRQGLAPR